MDPSFTLRLTRSTICAVLMSFQSRLSACAPLENHFFRNQKTGRKAGLLIYFTAMHSISTLQPFGIAATSTQLLAG